MRRAGRRARTQARIVRDQFFRDNAALFTVVGAIWGLASGLAIWLSQAWLRPYLIGSSITVSVWLFSTMLNVSGAPRYDMGAGAELWTSKELHRLGRAWRVIDGVEFADGDVDHVLIGPRGIFAVETKWTGYECDLDKEVLPMG